MKPKEADIVLSKELAMVAYSHLPKTADEAKAKGAKMVFTGEPCRRGHYSPRYAVNMNCVACQKQMVKDRRQQKRDEEDRIRQVTASKEAEETKQRLARNISSAEDAELGQAIAAYLINEGADSIIPGVIRHAEPIVKQTEWLLAAIRKAIHHRIACRDRASGILFFPKIIIDNRPRDEFQSKYWREAFEKLPCTVMTNGIKAMVTTMLIREFDTTAKPRDRATLYSWFGTEEPVGNASEGIEEAA